MAEGSIDLGPALKDAYLRKVAFGKECETVELTVHVLRRALGARERDQDRIAGFRFRSVRGFATEATRWDRDAGRWVASKVDWLGGLARDQVERPIIGTALAGAEGTLERWRKAAEGALWLRGRPEDLDEGGPVALAAQRFELTAEVILPNGWNANGRIFIASDALDVVGSRGPIALEDLVRAGEDWRAKWREYWARKERRPETPEIAQFEIIQPEPGELD